MQGNCMNYFFSLLKFSLWALNISCLWPLVIKITWSCERSSELWYFSRCFINCDNITCHYFFFLNWLNHFLSQIINCFHFSCFQSNFSCFCTTLNWFVNFNFNNFSFNNLSFLSYSDSYLKKIKKSLKIFYRNLEYSKFEFWK